MRSPSPGGPLAAFTAALDGEAAERRRARLDRALSLPAGVDFASNDYLGLSRHPAVAEAMRAALAEPPYGAPASRLLRGNLAAHEELEERLALWKGAEAALLFSSGYSANLGVLGALVRKQDRALSDELNHASLIDGLKLSGACREVYPHLDLEELERLLRRPHPAGRTFIVTETLFSMEGDIAPLDRLQDLADRHGALLILDDAHATGLYGERGSGLAEEFGVARRAAAVVASAGKALGLAGAFAAGPRAVVECLLNRARQFIYSTAPPPVLLAGIGAALGVVAREPGLRRRLLEHARLLRSALRARGVETPASESPILPVLIGDSGLALRVAARVRERGFDVRAVRPPSVPEGTARVRLSVHADRTAAEIEGLAAALSEALAAEAVEVRR